MPIIKKSAAALIIIFLLISVSFAYDDLTGTTSGSFMKLGGGVRAGAMGGAYTAISDDTGVIYWNPAGIAGSGSVEISSEYVNWPAGMSYSNISCVFPGSKIAAGLSVNYLNAGGIDETTLAQPYGTGNTINPTATDITFALAKRTRNNLSFGGSFSLLSDNIGTDSVNGFGLDAGIQWKPTKQLSLGMCAKNAFAYLGKEPVSSSCDFGASLTSKYLILSSDLDFPNDNNPVARIGMEVRIRDMLFLRAGLTTASEGGNSANLSCGVGLRAGDFRFDYAYAPVSDIGASHRCSVSFFFDRKIIAKKAKTDPVKTTNHGSRQPQNKRT